MAKSNSYPSRCCGSYIDHDTFKCLERQRGQKELDSARANEVAEITKLLEQAIANKDYEALRKAVEMLVPNKIYRSNSEIFRDIRF